MGGKVAVGGAAEASLGEPTPQHPQQLPQQFGRRLGTASSSAIALLGTVQSHQQRQSPAAAWERQRDQHSDDEPLVSPTESRGAMGRADGVPRTALAVNVFALVFVHGVVAGQEEGSIRQQVFEAPSGQKFSQPPTRPATLCEEATVAGGMAGNEGCQGT